MKKTQKNLRIKDSINDAILYTAFNSATESGSRLSTTQRRCVRSPLARGIWINCNRRLKRPSNDLGLKGKYGWSAAMKQAAMDFWLHRYLLSCGIGNVVVDSASIEVNRRKRRAKTDRIDARKFLHKLLRYHGGEQLVWRVVNVPSEQSEDGRQSHRELDAPKKERTMHRNRLKSLLIQQGIVVSNPSSRKFLTQLEALRTWDGKELPEDLKSRIIREHGPLRMVEEQIYASRLKGDGW